MNEKEYLKLVPVLASDCARFGGIIDDHQPGGFVNRPSLGLVRTSAGLLTCNIQIIDDFSYAMRSIPATFRLANRNRFFNPPKRLLDGGSTSGFESEVPLVAE